MFSPDRQIYVSDKIAIRRLFDQGGDVTREASLGILVAMVIKVWHLYCRVLCAQYMETQVWPQNCVSNLYAEMLYAKDAKMDICWFKTLHFIELIYKFLIETVWREEGREGGN